LEEVDEFLDVIPVVVQDPVGEWGVVTVVLKVVVVVVVGLGFLLKTPDEAIDGILELEAAE
jgi:hypothetical protein